MKRTPNVPTEPAQAYENQVLSSEENITLDKIHQDSTLKPITRLKFLDQMI